MARNPERRAQLADAAVRVVGNRGSRALTHRAVDTEAAMPIGTASNYFRSRAELFMAVAHRAFELLQPSVEQLARLADRPADIETTSEYAADVAERLFAHPELALSLIELRLEATRDPELATVLGGYLREGLAADVAFHIERGLPSPEIVPALHYLVLGVVLDHLSVPLVPDDDPLSTVRTLTRRLLGPARRGSFRALAAEHM